MQKILAVDLGALSRFEQAVLRFAPDGRCIFANAAAHELNGGHDPVGQMLTDFFPEPRERDQVADEFNKRLQGDASAYPSCFTRPHSGERVPISVFALPVTGEDGGVAGSLAIVRDRREEEMTRALHQAVETLRSGRAIIDAVAEQLARVMEFDDFKVIAVSEDRRHLRVLRTSNAPKSLLDTFKWWAMPEFISQTIDREVPRTVDVREMFLDPAYARMAEADPASRQHLNTVRYSLSLPIRHGEQIHAFLALERRGERPFREDELALCQNLPLGQAVLMALHFEEQRQLQACVDIVREMGQHASNVGAVAAVLAQRLAQDFGWNRVAVFQRDEDQGNFRAISQAVCEPGTPASSGEMHGEIGLVAEAFHQQRVVYEEPVLPATPVEDWPPIVRSRLALPIPGDTRRWVLQVESNYAQAFAAEEEQTLNMLALEAGHVLERVALLEMRDAILTSINDAVLETDRRCVIRRANPAALDLLGLATEADADGKSLKDFIGDATMAQAIAGTETFSRHEVEIVTSDGRRVGALLSGAPLPVQLGGRVFVLSDLTYEREVQKLSLLKEVFRGASLESRLPLALAAGWLADLQRADPSTRPIVEKVLKQLRKADLPLERLLRLGTPDEPTGPHRALDLEQLIEEVLAEMPDSEARAIAWPRGPGRTPVRAQREDLRFCLESVLSFALRTRPQDRRIELRVNAGRRTAAISLIGDWTPDFGPGESAGVLHRWRRQTVTDLALATGEMDAIMKTANGRFGSELGSQVMFELELPLADKEEPHGLGTDPA